MFVPALWASKAGARQEPGEGLPPRLTGSPDGRSSGLGRFLAIIAYPETLAAIGQDQERGVGSLCFRALSKLTPSRGLELTSTPSLCTMLGLDYSQNQVRLSRETPRNLRQHPQGRRGLRRALSGAMASASFAKDVYQVLHLGAGVCVNI